MNIPLNIDWQQILIHIFNFLILVVGLYLLLYKPVKDFMDKRTKLYIEMDNQAKEKLDQAEELKISYQESMDKIQEEIGRKRIEATQDAQQAAAALLSNAEQKASKIILDAHEAIKQERAKILEDTKQEIALLAISATEKLLTKSGSGTLDQFLEAVKKE